MIKYELKTNLQNPFYKFNYIVQEKGHHWAPLKTVWPDKCLFPYVCPIKGSRPPKFWVSFNLIKLLYSTKLIS